MPGVFEILLLRWRSENSIMLASLAKRLYVAEAKLEHVARIGSRAFWSLVKAARSNLCAINLLTVCKSDDSLAYSAR